MDLASIAQVVALAIAAIAAVTDWRRGEIPNWLTLPPLAAAPIAYAIVDAPIAGAQALGAGLVCGLVPYLLFRRGAAGGGDVKLFAAIGALLGLSIGLEAELLTFLATALVSLGRLAWDGKLLRTLANSLYLGVNPILPQRLRREVAPELMTAVRLGGFVFIGTFVALAVRHPW
jgi:prepilin peptidase CpaA